jgi:hypothetical protein
LRSTIYNPWIRTFAEALFIPFVPCLYNTMNPSVPVVEESVPIAPFELPEEILVLSGQVAALTQMVASLTGILAALSGELAVLRQSGADLARNQDTFLMATHTVEAAVQDLGNTMAAAWDNGVRLNPEGIAAVREVIRDEVTQKNNRVMQAAHDVRELMEGRGVDESVIAGVISIIRSLII